MLDLILLPILGLVIAWCTVKWTFVWVVTRESRRIDRERAARR